MMFDLCILYDKSELHLTFGKVPMLTSMWFFHHKEVNVSIMSILTIKIELSSKFLNVSTECCLSFISPSYQNWAATD